MEVIGKGIVDNLDLGIGQQLIIVVINVGDVILGRHLYGILGRARGQGMDNSVGGFLNCRDDTHPGNIGISQDPPLDRLSHPKPPRSRPGRPSALRPPKLQPPEPTAQGALQSVPRSADDPQDYNRTDNAAAVPAP